MQANLGNKKQSNAIHHNGKAEKPLNHSNETIGMHPKRKHLKIISGISL